MSLQWFLTRRPICVVGITTAMHSLMYGVGYAFKAGGFESTVLYPHVAEIMPPAWFGIVLIVTALLLIFGYVKEYNKLVSKASFVQSVAWLFAFIVYAMNGAFFLGVGVALVWAFLSGYLAIYFENRKAIQDEIYYERWLDENS